MSEGAYGSEKLWFTQDAHGSQVVWTGGAPVPPDQSRSRATSNTEATDFSVPIGFSQPLRFRPAVARARQTGGE